MHSSDSILALRRWPRPSVTVDAAIVAALGGKQDQAQLLLIQRKNTPCQSMWALPGGFVDENECLDRAVARELQEETSIDPKDLTLFQVRCLHVSPWHQLAPGQSWCSPRNTPELARALCGLRIVLFIGREHRHCIGETVQWHVSKCANCTAMVECRESSPCSPMPCSIAQIL